MICPKCRSRAVGRIGQNQYYCWDCNIEFVPTRDGFRMYRLESDGTIILDSLDANPQAVMMAGGHASPAGAILHGGLLAGGTATHDIDTMVNHGRGAGPGAGEPAPKKLSQGVELKEPI